MDKVVIMIFPNSSTGILEKKLQRIMETFCTSVVTMKESERSQEEMRKGMNDYN